MGEFGRFRQGHLVKEEQLFMIHSEGEFGVLMGGEVGRAEIL